MSVTVHSMLKTVNQLHSDIAMSAPSYHADCVVSSVSHNAKETELELSSHDVILVLWDATKSRLSMRFTGEESCGVFKTLLREKITDVIKQNQSLHHPCDEDNIAFECLKENKIKETVKQSLSIFKQTPSELDTIHLHSACASTPKAVDRHDDHIAFTFHQPDIIHVWCKILGFKPARDVYIDRHTLRLVPEQYPKHKDWDIQVHSLYFKNAIKRALLDKNVTYLNTQQQKEYK